MDLEGFGRMFYLVDAETRPVYNMFVGYLSVEHYDHNQKVDDRKAFGGHGVYMRTNSSRGGNTLAVVYSGIYRLDR